MTISHSTVVKIVQSFSHFKHILTWVKYSLEELEPNNLLSTCCCTRSRILSSWRKWTSCFVGCTFTSTFWGSISRLENILKEDNLKFPMGGREGTSWFSTKFFRLGAIIPCEEVKMVLKPAKVTLHSDLFHILKIIWRILYSKLTKISLHRQA